MTAPPLEAVLRGVSPCDRCGATTRMVAGHGVRCAGLVDVRCIRCGALSSMRPGDAEACAG